MERKITFEPGLYYHIFNRGVEKRAIFLDDNDRSRFQHLLYLTNGNKPLVYKRIHGLPLDIDRGTQHVNLLAYGLMTNHFHIVGQENDSRGLSKFMSKLSTSYSMYFNTKHQRSGSLLGHPFRAKHIDSDDYFRWVMSYVHLNPLDLVEPDWKEKGIKAPQKAITFLESYCYSSYPDYFGPTRPEGKIINKEMLPIDISSLESFDAMLKEFTDPFERPDLEVW
ncbi:MAG: transposase [Patescibacteria group bacterium]|nr:transposase [Patescibacteria group bacterium]